MADDHPEKKEARERRALKWVFALEYVMQGLANPFQGITYHPFFRHFRFHYKLSQAATQKMFAHSYLAWSFKPLLGFFIDAYGRTRVILTVLLSLAIGFYLMTPVADVSAWAFFSLMFVLSVVLACTDVAVDRATVVAGEQEAAESGRSKATTVGLNQAICWAAIYGTSIIASASGGYVAENWNFDLLMMGLALVPAILLGFVLRLPKDRAVPIPLRKSVGGFWAGLNTGPVLWVIAFYFLFHFQPALGALWTSHLVETLGYSQTHVGYGDAARSLGMVVGVALFARLGVRLQERHGLRTMFRIYIPIAMALSFTAYLLVDPWFSKGVALLHGLTPDSDLESVRLWYLAGLSATQAVVGAVIQMSTFSLVGAIIPAKAAGSLFAGFMSVANLAYSLSYTSGAWLFEHGLGWAPMREVQESVFGIDAQVGAPMSISMLVLLGSVAHLLSFLAVHKLPDRDQTLHAEQLQQLGPERWQALGQRVLDAVNTASAMAALILFVALTWGIDQSFVSALLFSFFVVTFGRKVLLDILLSRASRL